MLPCLFLMKIFTDFASYLSSNFTVNFLLALTFDGDVTFVSGLANFVLKSWSAPLNAPLGFVATTLKWYVVQGVSFEMSAETSWVLGTLHAAFGELIPGGHVPIVRVGVCLPYEVFVPYWKKYWVMRPPWTFGPAMP